MGKQYRAAEYSSKQNFSYHGLSFKKIKVSGI
jgi:hypothetical protein